MLQLEVQSREEERKKNTATPQGTATSSAFQTRKTTSNKNNPFALRRSLDTSHAANSTEYGFGGGGRQSGGNTVVPDYQTRQESRTLTTRSKSRGGNKYRGEGTGPGDQSREAKRQRYTAAEGSKRMPNLGNVQVNNKADKVAQN